MTTTTHGQVPEALRLAEYIDDLMDGSMVNYDIDDLEKAAAELRRLHVENAALRAAHVQNPAEIEHVAGDVSKNGAEVNTNVYAELPPRYYLVGGVEKTWDQQQMCVFADATHALRAQQPPPPKEVSQGAYETGWKDGYKHGAWSTQQPAPATQQAGEVIDLIGKLVQAESNKTRTHQEYMGKAMPDDVYARFQRLRDETIPALRTQLLDALATRQAGAEE